MAMLRKIFLFVAVLFVFGDVQCQVARELSYPPTEARKVTVKGPEGRKLKRMLRERKQVSALSRELVENHKFQFNAYYVEDPRLEDGQGLSNVKIRCYGGRLIIGDMNTTSFTMSEFVSKGDEFLEFDILIKTPYRSPYTTMQEKTMLLKCAVNTINGKMGVKVFYGNTPGPTYFGYINWLQ